MKARSTKKQLLSLLLSAVTILSCAGCSNSNEKYYNPSVIVETIEDDNLEMKDARFIIKDEALTAFPLYSETDYENERVDKAFYNLRTDYKFKDGYNFLNHYLDYLEENNIDDVYTCAKIDKTEAAANINISYTGFDKKTYGIYIADNSTFSEKNEYVTEDAMTDNLIISKRYEFTADIPAGDKKQDDPYGKWSICYILNFRDEPYSVEMENTNYMKKIGDNFINQGSEYKIRIYYNGEICREETFDKSTFFKYADAMHEIYQNNLSYANSTTYPDNKIFKEIKLFCNTKIKTK